MTSYFHASLLYCLTETEIFSGKRKETNLLFHGYKKLCQKRIASECPPGVRETLHLTTTTKKVFVHSSLSLSLEERQISYANSQETQGSRTRMQFQPEHFRTRVDWRLNFIPYRAIGTSITSICCVKLLHQKILATLPKKSSNFILLNPAICQHAVVYFN